MRIEKDGNLYIFQNVGIGTTNYAARLNLYTADANQKLIEAEYNNVKTFSVYGDGRTQIQSSHTQEALLKVNTSNSSIFEVYHDRVGIGDVFPDNFYGQSSPIVRIKGKVGQRQGAISFENENVTGRLEIGQNSHNAFINTFDDTLVINFHENRPIDIYGKTTTNKGLRAKNDVGLPAIEVDGTGGNYRIGQIITCDNNQSKPLVITNTSLPQNKKDVFAVYGDGYVFAREVKVELNNSRADYVFEKDYPLMPLQELKAYIQKHKHLPKIPTAQEAQAYGVELGKMNELLLEKIEELTLYILQLEERIKKMEGK
jgi:hypothetical protein